MENEKLNGFAKEIAKQESNSELVQSRPIEKTPFTMVKVEDKYFLTMGKYRLSEPMKSWEEVEEDAKDTSWWRLLQIMQIMIESEAEVKKFQQTMEGQIKTNN